MNETITTGLLDTGLQSPTRHGPYLGSAQSTGRKAVSQARVTVLSGLGEKRPAAILVEARGLRILLDAGGALHPGQDCDWYQGLDLDAVLLTQDQQDHAGGVKYLPEHIPIYASAATARCLPPGRIWRELPMQGFTYIDDIAIQTGRSGQALGGVWLHLDIGGGVFYSGDFSCESLLYPFDVPPRAELALLDATYGLYDQTRLLASETLELLLLEKPALLPVPPSGRAVEIALWRHQAGCTDWSLDPACYENLTRLVYEGDDMLLPGIKQQLRDIMPQAAQFNPHAHLILAGEADGIGGEAGRLIREGQFSWADVADNQEQRYLIYTGYVPPHGPKGSHVLRWNVHPRLNDLRWVVNMVEPTYTVPLFTTIHDERDWTNGVGKSLSLQRSWSLADA